MAKLPMNRFLHTHGVHRGITLFELLAALCVLSVVSSIGYVSLKPLWYKQVLSNAVTDLENTLQFLRMSAIIENATIQLKLDSSSLRYRKRKGSGWGEWRLKALDSSIVHSAGSSIYFSGSGFTSPKTVTLKYGNLNQNLIININGRIRTSEVY